MPDGNRIEGAASVLAPKAPTSRGKLELSIGRRIGVLLLAILWLWPSDLFAQSEALMKAYRQGKTLDDAGQYEQAIRYYRQVLKLSEAEFSPDHPSVASSLNNLAELNQVIGRYAEAETLYKRALAIREEALGPDHLDVATLLDNLANLLFTQGRITEAVPLMLRSLAIRKKEMLRGLGCFDHDITKKPLECFEEAPPTLNPTLAILAKTIPFQTASSFPD